MKHKYYGRTVFMNIHLAKSLAYVSFTMVMLQIMQDNCNILNNDIIYGFGKTAYLNMCL